MELHIFPRKSPWELQKEKLLLRFPTLSETEIAFDETERDTMLYALHMKLGVPVEDLQNIIDSL